MLTAANIATIQSALDTLAAIPSAQLATTSAATIPLLDLHITCYYCAPREYTVIGARKITRKVSSRQYEAECEIDSLDVSATGATRAAALRNLFKAIRNAASLNAPTLRVPLVLCEPTKAKAEARAKRKADLAEIERVRARCAAVRAEREAKWHAELDRAATAVEAERAAAPTIIVAAAHDASLDVKSQATRIVCNNLAPRFVEAPIIPAGAEAGTEGTFKALLGLRTEQKIVALANALQHAGVTIYRVEEDGAPIIRASTHDRGTATVLNL